MKHSLITLLVILLIAIGCNHKNDSLHTSVLLNAQEEVIYSQLLQDYKESFLLNVPPLTIAKLYLYAQYNSKYELAYRLYTERIDYIMWSEEDYLTIPAEHRLTKEDIINLFQNINEGIFIQQNENEGYIELYKDSSVTNINNAENKAYFMLVKNVDEAIWKVSFMPMQ